MPCCGDREKIGDIKPEQMWDYINLNDFKSTSCLTPFSYVTLWIFLLISIAVYAVDTFTAVNLLVFSRWAGQIKPSIPFSVSRWIFAVCIIISFVLLAFRWLHTIRVIRSGSVAESYLDPLAVRIQSIRLGSGKGWKRFLVFAELTKSKKGADYVALFSYFSFESWLRVCFADGPRQVVNAITLYSVMQLDLIPEGKHAAPEGTSPIVQFFINVKALAEKNDQQAVVLVGMLFTLVIWVISILSLALSVVLYIIFLWHHIPSQDGTLKRYCRRKINTRLERIVKRKVNKALAKGVVLQDRNPTKPAIAGEEPKPRPLVPTLPSIGDIDNKPPLSRQATQSTLPPYSSRTATPIEKPGMLRQPTLPNLEDDGPMLTKTTTQSSAYADSAPLVGNAETMGYSPLDRQGSPAPPYNRPYSPATRPPAQNRATPGPMPMEGLSRRTPGPGYAAPDQGYPRPPPSSMGRRTPAAPPGGAPPSRAYTPAGSPPSRSLTQNDSDVPGGSASYHSYTPASNGPPPRQRGNGGYVAYNPGMGNGDARAQSRTSPTYRNFARPSSANEGGYRAMPANYRPSTSTPQNGPPGHYDYDSYSYGRAV